MSEVNQVLKDIKNNKLYPIYFLSGDEPFYIDLISKAIENEVLTEDEKGFNQSLIYGNDVSIDDVIGMAKQFPMGAERQVIILKEAQHLYRTIDRLEAYANNPQPTTVLVVNYKGKTIDKRTKFYKALKKSSLLLEFKKLYENKIPDWIDSHAREMGMTIDTKSKFMMTEFLGSDLGRIHNELNKLKVISPDGKITPEIVERNIGISKDYNNFELRNALETRNAPKAFQIAKYFSENPRDNKLLVTLGILYGAFSNIIVYHTLADKSQQNVAKELKIHPFFAKDASVAAKSYPLKKATRIISLLRDTDVKSKGVGASGNVSEHDLLNELIVKIFAI